MRKAGSVSQASIRPKSPRPPVLVPPPPNSPVALRQTPAQVRATLGVSRRPRPSTFVGTPDGYYCTIFSPDIVRAPIFPIGYFAEIELENAREKAQMALESVVSAQGQLEDGDQRRANHQHSTGVLLSTSQHVQIIGDNTFGVSNSAPEDHGAVKEAPSSQRPTQRGSAPTSHAQTTTASRLISALSSYPPLDQRGSNNNTRTINIPQHTSTISTRASLYNPDTATCQTSRAINISTVVQFPVTAANHEWLQAISTRSIDYSRLPMSNRTTGLPQGCRFINATNVFRRSPVATPSRIEPDAAKASYCNPMANSTSISSSSLGQNRTASHTGPIQQLNDPKTSHRRNRHGSPSGDLMGTLLYEAPGSEMNGNIYNPSALRSPDRAADGMCDSPVSFRSLKQRESHQLGEVPEVLVPITSVPEIPWIPSTAQYQAQRANVGPFPTPAPEPNSTPFGIPVPESQVDPASSQSASTIMLGYKDSTPHQIPIGELNTGGLTPRVHRWLDGCDDEDVNPPVTSDPRFLIRDSDDVEDLYSVGVPQHTETDRSTDIQGDSPRETERGKDNHMENDWFDIPEDIQEPSQSKPDSAFAPPGAPLLVLRPPESNSTSHCTLGPPRYGSFVRTLTSGPRRGSDGVPAHNTHTHALSNRTMPLGSESIDMNLISGIPSGSVNPAIPRKLVKSTLAGRLRRATSNWMAGNRKPAMKRLSAMNSRPNSAISPALESSTAAEDVLALSAMGYIAPLGSNLAGSDITLEERFHTTEDNPTARGSGNKGVSRLKKLKSFASLSNLAAAFKIGDSAQATVEKKSSRNMVISAPISTTGNPEMIEQANRVRQQMLEAMGGLEGVSLASSRYAGTIPGTILGEGAIRVDPQDGCGRNNRANSKQRSKDGEYPGLGERQDNTGEHESEGVLERALRTRTQKKPLGAHSIFSTVDNAPRITSPGTVDPHEGRAYEGIWSGPGIAVNTPEGGIRVIQQQMRETEETSPYLDPHPGVPFYIPEDAPEPTPLGIHRTARGHPTSQEGPTMGHLLGSPGISFPSAATSLSDPFGWEREYERTYGPTSPPRRAVPSCGGNSGQTHMPVRENAPVWSLLRKANNRFFGRTKGESGAAQQEDSIAGPIIPPKSLPKSAPKTPKRKGSSTAASATMPSRTEQPGNTKLTSSDVEATTAQGGVVQPRVMPMSISSSRESQRFPDSVETTPFVLPQTRRDTGTQPGSDDKLGNPTATSEARQNDNTNGSEDKVVDGVIVTSPQPEQTDTNWSDTESGRDEAAATTEHHRKQSISNSDTYAALRVILDQSSSDSEHAEAHALPGPITSLHRPLTTDGVADTEHMLAVHQIETAQQERQVAVGVAKETACKREQAEAINKSTEKLKGSENLRPPGNSGTFLVSSTPQAGGGGQTGTLSSRSPPLPFVLGSEDDPFYDADLEDSMQTASRQLVTESLNSGEPTLFANTRSQLLTAFRNSSSVNTPTGGPLQEHRIPFSHAQMPENASQWMPDRSEAYHSHQSQIPEAQRVLLEQQGLADTQLYRPPHSRLEQEMIARRVRENRFLTENHRRILAGQIPLLSIEEQERLAPRSGPSPPPAFRARNDTTGALFLRPVTPTLTSSRMERMAVSPPDSPTPLGDGGVGRESLV